MINELFILMDLATSHMLRKFFNTHLINAGSRVEISELLWVINLKIGFGMHTS